MDKHNSKRMSEAQIRKQSPNQKDYEEDEDDTSMLRDKPGSILGHIKPAGKLSASASQTKFDDYKDGKSNTNSKSKGSKRFKGRPGKDEDGNDYVMDTEDAPMRRDSEMIRLIAGDDMKSSLGVGKDSDKTIIGQ